MMVDDRQLWRIPATLPARYASMVSEPLADKLVEVDDDSGGGFRHLKSKLGSRDPIEVDFKRQADSRRSTVYDDSLGEAIDLRFDSLEEKMDHHHRELMGLLENLCRGNHTPTRSEWMIADECAPPSSPSRTPAVWKNSQVSISNPTQMHSKNSRKGYSNDPVRLQNTRTQVPRPDLCGTSRRLVDSSGFHSARFQEFGCQSRGDSWLEVESRLVDWRKDGRQIHLKKDSMVLNYIRSHRLKRKLMLDDEEAEKNPLKFRIVGQGGWNDVGGVEFVFVSDEYELFDTMPAGVEYESDEDGNADEEPRRDKDVGEVGTGEGVRLSVQQKKGQGHTLAVQSQDITANPQELAYRYSDKTMHIHAIENGKDVDEETKKNVATESLCKIMKGFWNVEEIQDAVDIVVAASVGVLVVENLSDVAAVKSLSSIQKLQYFSPEPPPLYFNYSASPDGMQRARHVELISSLVTKKDMIITRRVEFFTCNSRKGFRAVFDPGGNLCGKISSFVGLLAGTLIEEELVQPLHTLHSELSPLPIVVASLEQVYKARSTGVRYAVHMACPELPHAWQAQILDWFCWWEEYNGGVNGFQLMKKMREEDGNNSALESIDFVLNKDESTGVFKFLYGAFSTPKLNGLMQGKSDKVIQEEALCVWISVTQGKSTLAMKMCVVDTELIRNWKKMILALNALYPTLMIYTARAKSSQPADSSVVDKKVQVFDPGGGFIFFGVVFIVTVRVTYEENFTFREANFDAVKSEAITEGEVKLTGC